MSIALGDKNVRDYLKSIMHEALKMYRVYDGTNRLQYQYEAPTWALDGDACMRTEYVYDGTTTRVIKLKETMQNWDSTWDI